MGGERIRDESDYLSINIAEVSTSRAHNVLYRSVGPQAVAGDHRTQVEERGSTSRVRGYLGRIHLPADGTSSKRVCVVRVAALPVVPDLVNHRMVKVEHGIVRGPLHSRVTIGGPQPKWTLARHIAPEDEMRSRMGSTDTLQISLEADIVTRERVYGEIHILRRESCVDHKQWVHRWRTGGDGHSLKEGLKGIITANVVWDGISDLHVLETASRDLEVVLGVTPVPEAIIGGVGKDSRVVKGRSILCPVPIRMNSYVSALLSHSVLERLNVYSMPGEEETGSVNQNIEVHVSIHEVIPITAGRVYRPDQ